MAKMLNLDDVSAQTGRFLKFKGKEYPLESMSVAGYIEFAKKTEKVDENSSISEQMEMMLDMVTGAFPSMEKEVRNSLKFEQLNAIIGFINEVNTEDAPSAEEGEDGKK